MRQGPDDIKREDLILLGMPEEAIDEWVEKPAAPPKLLTGCEDIVRLFFGLETQWRTSPLGQLEGLEYASVPVTARMLGIRLTPAIFMGLQVMEREWLRSAPKKKKPLFLSRPIP
ncbi:MAG: DUF1799 domain-containing protein [Pseudomonadota bacterium]